eukprot:1131975-Amorphochlora_amoeboformis.AAC.2
MADAKVPIRALWTSIRPYRHTSVGVSDPYYIRYDKNVFAEMYMGTYRYTKTSVNFRVLVSKMVAVDAQTACQGIDTSRNIHWNVYILKRLYLDI